MRTIAIVLAAGQGTRMKSHEKKQYMMLQGRPILYYALKAFEDSFVDAVVLVTNKGEEKIAEDIVVQYRFKKVAKVTQGGKERYHSVACGLKSAQKLGNYDYCFIHDSARPFLTSEILMRTYDAVKKYQACVAGMPVKDTIKIADPEGYVAYTPMRDLVWQIQTPQVFRFDLIRGAYERLLQNEKSLLESGKKITDDAMVVETMSQTKVYLVEGSYDNIKITTPEDLVTAEKILDSIKKG